jgi:hypothetical protein
MTARRGQRGSALVAALWAVTLAGVAAASLAELGRLAALRARLDRDGLRAWFLAEAGLAETVAAFPPGRDFDAELAALSGGDARPEGTWTWAALALDDPDDDPDDPLADANSLIQLRITAWGPFPVRRRLEALIGRNPEPFFPGAATLAGGGGTLAEDFVLDGRDYTMGSGCTVEAEGLLRAGLALPEGAPEPSIDRPGTILGAGGPPSVVRAPPPDLGPLGAETGGARVPGGSISGDLGTAGTPRLTIVEGDALVEDVVQGAGVLFATGRLRVEGILGFSGIVAAAGGVEVTDTGTLLVCGGLWAAGDPALEARGAGTVRASAEALRAAATVARLPARPRVVAMRELL